MLKGIFGGVMPVLERALDIRALRHDIISSNIANEETPGYRVRDIEFQRELDKRNWVQLVSTHKNHFHGSNRSHPDVQVVIREDPVNTLDNNSVSLEREMVKMAENTMMYNATVTILVRKFQAIREAIGR